MSKIDTNQSEMGCSTVNIISNPSNYGSNIMCDGDDDDADPFGEEGGRCTDILTLLTAAVLSPV